MLGLACLILRRGLERGRQESPGWTGTLMHGFSDQKTIFYSSCAVVLPARRESPCAALHGPLKSILPGAEDSWWTFSKPCAYAAIYLFRPLCRLTFRFALAGWSPQARSVSAVRRGVRERGWLSLGGVSFQSWRHACFSFKGCFS